MDDYSLTSLIESKNEWCSRLVNILTPCIIQGLKSIFDEAYQLCLENDDEEKYLMTFQNFLSRVPKWNDVIINKEVIRIGEKSGCGYLEDLITCVHIVQLKALTVSRVGSKQKKIDLDVPPINQFVHKCYINVARKVYTNIYLFEKGIAPLDIQKNNRELEVIIKEMILNTVRENIPVELILKAYLDETEELDVSVEEKKELIPLKSKTVSTSVAEELEKEIKKEDNNLEKEDNIKIEVTNKNIDDKNIDDKNIDDKIEDQFKINDNDRVEIEKKNQDIKFSDIDIAVDTLGTSEEVEAPKTLERLEQISREANNKRKEEEQEDEDSERLSFGDDVKFDLGIEDLTSDIKSGNDILLKDIEIL
tara:strand:- start:3993 stop:5081 length:1089 start_codon:yes stop_codon:yes gene_type:complete